MGPAFVYLNLQNARLLEADQCPGDSIQLLNGRPYTAHPHGGGVGPRGICQRAQVTPERERHLEAFRHTLHNCLVGKDHWQLEGTPKPRPSTNKNVENSNRRHARVQPPSPTYYAPVPIRNFQGFPKKNRGVFCGHFKPWPLSTASSEPRSTLNQSEGNLWSFQTEACSGSDRKATTGADAVVIELRL